MGKLTIGLRTSRQSKRKSLFRLGLEDILKLLNFPRVVWPLLQVDVVPPLLDYRFGLRFHRRLYFGKVFRR